MEPKLWELLASADGETGERKSLQTRLILDSVAKGKKAPVEKKGKETDSVAKERSHP